MSVDRCPSVASSCSEGERIESTEDTRWKALRLGIGGDFCAAMGQHPRFGRVFAGTGLAVGAGLIFLNIYSFPRSPSEVGFFNPGPVIGLCYLAIRIQMSRSMRVLVTADLAVERMSSSIRCRSRSQCRSSVTQSARSGRFYGRLSNGFGARICCR